MSFSADGVHLKERAVETWKCRPRSSSCSFSCPDSMMGSLGERPGFLGVDAVAHHDLVTWGVFPWSVASTL